jgi:hypothetical protein
MTAKRIGALVIDKSPRLDLASPSIKLLPGCKILQTGALEEVTLLDLPNLTRTA